MTHTQKDTQFTGIFCVTPLHWFSVVGEGEGKLGIKGNEYM